MSDSEDSCKECLGPVWVCCPLYETRMSAFQCCRCSVCGRIFVFISENYKSRPEVSNYQKMINARYDIPDSCPVVLERAKDGGLHGKRRCYVCEYNGLRR